MKLVKGYALIKQTELDESLREAEKRGVEKGEKSSKARITELEKAVTKKQNELESQADKAAAEQEKLKRKLDISETKVTILEEERDEVREVVAQQLKNADREALLDARKDILDEREAALKDRESKLESKEED